jgi:hypothetical protein
LRSLPAVIVVTERIADTEMHCMFGHLRGFVREVFRRNDGRAFDAWVIGRHASRRAS